MFFLYFLPKLEGGAGVFDTELFTKLKDKLIEEWDNIDKIHQVRGLYSLWDLGMYDEKLHELYSSMEFDTDSTIMGYICEL